MNVHKVAKGGAAICLAVQLALTAQFSTMAEAKMLTTGDAISKYAAQADRGFLLSEIKKQEIRDQIVALGVDPAEAEARLEALTDAEIASIVAQMEDGSAGADGAGALIGALLTIFIILLVTDLLCLTRVFKFTRCAIR